MCDVTMPGRGPTPDSASKWAFPQRRGLEGTPHSRCLFPTPPRASCFCQRAGKRLGPGSPFPTRPRAWTLLPRRGLCAVAEPFRIGLLLMYSVPECERLEPRSGPNSISPPWPHGCTFPSIHLRLHPSLLATEGVTKWQSENSLILLKKKEVVHCPYLPDLPSL